MGIAVLVKGARGPGGGQGVRAQGDQEEVRTQDHRQIEDPGREGDTDDRERGEHDGEVNHPNCVRLYDVFDTEEELFLVMELVIGCDLFDRIVEKQKYPESDAVRLVRNMATALHHLHSRNIIHRDLKPENLLVTKDKMGRDTLKLADF